MVKTRVLSSVLLAAGVLLMTACASDQPRTPLLEKKFQREAATYDKYDVHGQAVYCKRGEPATFHQLPGWQCLTEPQLREKVRIFERDRNQVAYNHSMTKGG